MLCLSSYTRYSASTFQRTSNSENNELLLSLFDVLWKLKACIVLFLNALVYIPECEGSFSSPNFNRPWISRNLDMNETEIIEFSVTMWANVN